MLLLDFPGYQVNFISNKYLISSHLFYQGFFHWWRRDLQTSSRQQTLEICFQNYTRRDYLDYPAFSTFQNLSDSIVIFQNRISDRMELYQCEQNHCHGDFQECLSVELRLLSRNWRSIDVSYGSLLRMDPATLELWSNLSNHFLSTVLCKLFGLENLANYKILTRCLVHLGKFSSRIA
jgi:hypothetical protein